MVLEFRPIRFSDFNPSLGNQRFAR